MSISVVVSRVGLQGVCADVASLVGDPSLSLQSMSICRVWRDVHLVIAAMSVSVKPYPTVKPSVLLVSASHPSQGLLEVEVVWIVEDAGHVIEHVAAAGGAASTCLDVVIDGVVVDDVIEDAIKVPVILLELRL